MKFKKPANIAVLGPTGTFSETAAKKFFTNSLKSAERKLKLVYFNEVDEIFEIFDFF